METNSVILSAAIIAACLGAVFLYNYFDNKKNARKSPESGDAKSSLPLKLQAYERLILLADRIALPNIVSRMVQPGLTAKEMQHLLTRTIRQEFDHNITQQIYVSPEAWDAIRNLKEQNLLIINQVASFLPESASGQDLGRSLMNLLIENPRASLHLVVSDALSFEAKQLM